MENFKKNFLNEKIHTYLFWAHRQHLLLGLDNSFKDLKNLWGSYEQTVLITSILHPAWLSNEIQASSTGTLFCLKRRFFPPIWPSGKNDSKKQRVDTKFFRKTERKNTLAFSNNNGYVWTGLQCWSDNRNSTKKSGQEKAVSCGVREIFKDKHSSLVS